MLLPINLAISQLRRTTPAERDAEHFAGVCCLVLKVQRQVTANCTCCNPGGICLADKYLTVTKEESVTPCMGTLSMASEQRTPFFRAPNVHFFGKGKPK